MTKSPEERGAEWLKSGNTGLSSKTIYNFFISGPPNDPHYPHDFADWERCQRLLETVPEWEPRLLELAALPGLDGKVWAALAEAWPALKKRYETAGAGAGSFITQTIMGITRPLEAASGEVARIGENASIRIRKDASPLLQGILAKAKGASDEEVKAAIQKAVSENSSDEDMLMAARYVVAQAGKAGASLLQRNLQIGYNRAVLLLQMLENEGSISRASAEDTDYQVSEKLRRANEITQKIGDIAEATGTTPEKVFNTAKNKLDERPAGHGHNSGDEPEAKDVGGVAGARLRSFLDRIERLEEEKSGIAEDIKDIFAEAKGVGFDVKTIRKILRLRKMEPEKRREEEELEELYKSAIGMI